MSSSHIQVKYNIRSNLKISFFDIALRKLCSYLTQWLMSSSLWRHLVRITTERVLFLWYVVSSIIRKKRADMLMLSQKKIMRDISSIACAVKHLSNFINQLSISTPTIGNASLIILPNILKDSNIVYTLIRTSQISQYWLMCKTFCNTGGS